MSPVSSIVLCRLFLFSCWLWINSFPCLAQEVSFNRDVLPILSDNCFQCHGPDQNTRQAGLRLDQELSALRRENPIIQSGDVENSQLIDRITTPNLSRLMPPASSKLKLSRQQIEILKRWISQGAKWNDHWSFVPPIKPELPSVSSQFPVQNEIDQFIQHRLAINQLTPSPRADKATLIRRVTMDLTGLPPTVEEIDNFLAKTSEDSYETLVDNLLASEAHAERLTLDWMDLARYADSHGMHADGWRRMWPWRDWVISAFQQNMPYDQFVTWQLAGDLLPNASQEQILATAFHRNHPMTAEGGVIDEEFRLYYVFDRVETTSTAFLGLTMNCARCHDHKFDPITQKEYYQLSAFFNNVRELGMTGDDGNYGPVLALPEEQVAKQLNLIDQKIQFLEKQLDQIEQQAKSEFAKLDQLPSLNPEFLDNMEVEKFPLEKIVSIDVEGKIIQAVDGNVKSTVSVSPRPMDGIDGNALWIDGEYQHLALKNVGDIDVANPVTVSLWIKPTRDNQVKDPSQLTNQTLLGTSGGKNQYWRGWELYLDRRGHLAVRLIHNLPDNLIHVRSIDPITGVDWLHVTWSYNGTGLASGVGLFVNGQPIDTEIIVDQLTRTILPENGTARNVRVGRSYRGFTGDFGIYRGGMDDIRFYQLSLTKLEVAQLYASYQQAKIDYNPAAENQFQHWLSRNHTEWPAKMAEYRELQKQRIELFSQVDLVMVMKEMDSVRPTHLLHRGEYNQPRELVEMGTPSAIADFPTDLPNNRLGLAKWLFAPTNPLTARVTVNRYWQMLFGHGLVRTPHDFGIQGQRPTHPQLLDWLAIKFRDSGWNIRHLLKLIVTSATYQQSSGINVASGQTDPENQLLWRSPTYRWPAEFLRDNALASSGVLVKQVGGPSVKPYQPEGLWIEKNNFSAKLRNYQIDDGDSLYRRSLYTFVRRTSPPPAMITLDAPNRSVCTVKRVITNTPLQALVMMNDPQFIESARILAEHIQRRISYGDSLAKGITEMFQRLTGHQPLSIQIKLLETYYQNNYQKFLANQSSVQSLLAVGEYPFDETLSATEVAALTVMANLIMNYDGFYMKR